MWLLLITHFVIGSVKLDHPLKYVILLVSHFTVSQYTQEDVRGTLQADTLGVQDRIDPVVGTANRIDPVPSSSSSDREKKTIKKQGRGKQTTTKLRRENKLRPTIIETASAPGKPSSVSRRSFVQLQERQRLLTPSNCKGEFTRSGERRQIAFLVFFSQTAYIF